MKQQLLFVLFWLSLLPTFALSQNRLLVISVDGLDYRYLRDADKLGLKIPNLRRLMREGEVTAGIEGVFPTVTWPSHTTLITGVAPARHGILGNRRPVSEGGAYYWDVNLLKTKTFWHATRAAGLKTAAITWPVTVNAAIDFNLPEYFERRNGGGMDLRSIEAKATPGLVEKIARVFPSFPQDWMDDRTRTQATVYLLKHEKPHLILLHLVDHDAEAHHNGPFSREANALIEYSDELIGQMLAAVPKDMVVAVVSDHGFERADKVVDVNQILKQEGVAGTVEMKTGFLTTRDTRVVAWLRAASAAKQHGIGREIPPDELQRFAPELSNVAAAFESAEHFLFGAGKAGEAYSEPTERGVHGLWPGRKDYASSFILWGKGIKPGRKPRASMLTIAPRLAEVLGVKLTP
ncbi:MAG TPA: ectonucleotide pyrophosphatase/phosphodiesterase [Blastocatellia bacterium]|nr:ectonucleotide pyrophosphatase/phosphodiesterase [Blastocatellia bacterium]